ncbi:GAF domain-containing protein [Achromobacter sp. ACM04]|uniref:GAF domain-containing protein n=1 Tax=Achromobacter TaxID=222 RepID=UPI001781A753|nr:MULTISPECIES: GAF domain-containing protein [Achromobacter]MBD9419951.1 GAF domain-containing protein [Achromobacter sp. ACM04]MBD9431181.1 GAF domain-containing protein [Achromobacter sp. ACM03]
MTVSIQSTAPAQAGVAAIARAYAAADPVAALRAIDAHAHAALAHTLCTVNRYDAQAMRVLRLYSSNPEAYPPGGSKDKSGTAWGRHVLLEQKLFVGEGEDAIREFFDDHDAIQRLGLRSVINVPVVYGGVCLGTVNFLMPRAAVSDADVQAAQLAGLLALPAFQALLPQS